MKHKITILHLWGHLICLCWNHLCWNLFSSCFSWLWPCYDINHHPSHQIWWFVTQIIWSQNFQTQGCKWKLFHNNSRWWYMKLIKENGSFLHERVFFMVVFVVKNLEEIIPKWAFPKGNFLFHHKWWKSTIWKLENAPLTPEMHFQMHPESHQNTP